ncbi:MAG: hypothetical protein ACRDHN_02335 [Thermomicrobiales bacterium]
MNLRRLIAVSAVGLSIGLAAIPALAVDDGTSGPQQATPDAAACDREVSYPDTNSGEATGTPGMIMGQIDAIDAATLSQYPPITDGIATEIAATLRSFGGCIQRDGAPGAFAFLQPGLSDIELIYLGVFAVSEPTPTMTASPEGFAPADQVADYAPKLIVQLPDNRVGAVIAAPQPGSDLALVTLVKVDGVWMIEHIAPVSDGDGDGSSGGGP